MGAGMPIVWRRPAARPGAHRPERSVPDRYGLAHLDRRGDRGHPGRGRAGHLHLQPQPDRSARGRGRRRRRRCLPRRPRRRPRAAPTETPAPTPSPTPALPGTIAFGSSLDGNRQVVTPVETFTPPLAFAYSVSMTEAFGASAIENEICEARRDGETIVLPREAVPRRSGRELVRLRDRHRRQLPRPWGPGEFEWRVYLNGERWSRGERSAARRADAQPSVAATSDQASA